MAKTPDDDAKAAETPAAVEQPAIPARPPVEFYSKDRWEAQTHVRAVWNVPHDIAERVRDALEVLAHTGPVHVLVHPNIQPDFPGVTSVSDVVGDGFIIRPFNFVKV